MNIKMKKFDDKKLEEMLELGKKLFDITQSQKENLKSYTHPYANGTDVWLAYSDKKFFIINNFVDLSLSDENQGPYRIRVEWTPTKASESQTADKKTVFTGYFYGAPLLADWLKEKYIKQKSNFKRKKFNIAKEKSDKFVYKPGRWIEEINDIHEDLGLYPVNMGRVLLKKNY